MSSKTIAQKLLLSQSERLELLGPLPDGVKRVERLDQAEVAVLFAESAASLLNSRPLVELASWWSRRP